MRYFRLNIIKCTDVYATSAIRATVDVYLVWRRLGTDYMANFSKGWNFVAITGRGSVRVSARVCHCHQFALLNTPSLRLLKFTFQPGLKFDCDYNFKCIFKKICFGSRAEVSARLSGLKFVMWSAPLTLFPVNFARLLNFALFSIVYCQFLSPVKFLKLSREVNNLLLQRSPNIVPGAFQ